MNRNQLIESYFCFSVAGIEKSHLEDGNRIVMPESSLQRLIKRDVNFPYYFHITKYTCCHGDNGDLDSEDGWNFSDHSSDYSIESPEDDGEDDSQSLEPPDPDQKQSDDIEESNCQKNEKENCPYSHCGVSEFTSDEGTVLLPEWMMTNLGLQNGDAVLLRSVKLENGLYVKLNPLNQNFFKIRNPKAVLETKLRRFACLTPGETIPIVYNHVTYAIHVVETKPSSGISIIETDCEVEFFRPEPPPAPVSAITAVCWKTEEKTTIKFRPFSGTGRRLRGVERVREEIVSLENGIRNIALDSKVKRQQSEWRKETEDEIKKKSNKFEPFTGKSRILDN